MIIYKNAETNEKGEGERERIGERNTINERART